MWESFILCGKPHTVWKASDCEKATSVRNHQTLGESEKKVKVVAIVSMLFCKEVFLLTFALSVWTSENRVKRQMVEQVRGGVKTSKSVTTAVALLINDIPSCSGTVLAKNWIVTAGHCFENENITESDIRIVAGVMNLLSKKAVEVGVKRIIKHPTYKMVKNDDEVLKILDWDLALLELDQPLEIDSNEMISKALLLPPGIKHRGKPITIGGWGQTDEFSAPSINHLSINATIKTTEDCLKTHPARSFHADRMFCAGTEAETTCRGNSKYI